jgi:predicted metalloprotease
MRWDPSHESSDVEDRRAAGSFGGRGGGVPLGGILAFASRFGWKGILVAVLLVGAATYGGMCTDALSCGASDRGGAVAVDHRATGGRWESGSQDDLAKFVGFVLDDVQETWQKQLPGYTNAKLVLFRGAVGSACGTASSAVGPFYCPLDRKVYIDLGFYDELRRRFGAPGDFAQAYVIAHEIGHHIQNQRGLLGRGEVHQIETELQADCLAGAWAQNAERRDLLEVGDIDEALNAAAQIGDDAIQRRSTGRIRPETWTHGSSAQRTGAFRRGYQGGAAACEVR